MTKPAAIAYVRVSTHEQADEGVSLRAQEERIRAYCELAGLDLVGIFREEGVSASKPLADRPQGKKLLRALKAKKAQHVLALKLDRLFRSAVDALEVSDSWDKKGVALHCVDQGGASIATNSAMGRFFLTTLAAIAEMERGLIAERTAAALASKKANGETYARTPLGFDAKDGQLVQNRAELRTVARIRKLRDKGKTLAAIADELNSRGVATKRGGKWHPSTVRYVLANDLYAGSA